MAAGAARNNVLQRLKLNNKVALITGGHSLVPLGGFLQPSHPLHYT